MGRTPNESPGLRDESREKKLKPTLGFLKSPFRLGLLAALIGVGLVVSMGQASLNPPYVDLGSSFTERWSHPSGPSYDWANGPASGAASACTTSGPATALAITCPGINGIFDGGIYRGATTPPTPPNYIA